MNKAVKQYTFPPLLDRRGKDTTRRQRDRPSRKDRRVPQGSGASLCPGARVQIDNPDASRYAVAKHLRETVWPEASQGTVEGAIRTWENAPHWRSYIPT